MIQVKKRDGRRVDFDPAKIINAIDKAMAAEHIDDPNCSVRIAADIMRGAHDGITVEEIQDLVEVELMKSEYKRVARAYITYRDQRSRERQRNTELNRRIADILMCKSVQNQNANVDEHSFSGRKFESANLMHRELALDAFLRPEVAKAHMDGRIYLHDLSEYDVGNHNCLFVDIQKLLRDGFSTRNGDVRPANSFSTACQLVAVIFQIQSQVQYGGVASAHLDYDLAPYVKKSFARHFADGMKYVQKQELPQDTVIELGDEALKTAFPAAFEYALDMLEREGTQAAQALFHNLNTLESRQGSQVPFTSINYGRDSSPEGRLVSRWLLEASKSGIGKYNLTPIFPISIFQYKKGVNDKPGTPNYDIKQLAIESLSRRIYPNIANCDWEQNIEDPENPDTYFATMGCRTLIGKDRHGMGYIKVGRGNVCPTTMNLPRIGIRHGICTGEREQPDIDGFWQELDEVLALTEKSLVDRFYHVCNQSVSSGSFMYRNGTVADAEKASARGIYEAMKHGTLAVGYIGVAEMCQALFGKDFADDEKVHEFALSVVRHIYDYTQEASQRCDLNFSCYATPAENLCKTFAQSLKREFGIIKNVTDREYITNSHHVPVWKEVSIYRKLELEAPFCKYPTGGCITYIELESSVMQNHKAIEDIIDYAMSIGIPYLAFNFPIDSCLRCGYQGEIEYNCPVCGNTSIQRLRRVTGYLTTDYRNFNAGKVAECLDRKKHSAYTSFN